MGDPVNLSYLRGLTGGDREMEKSLFEVFLSSSEECIAHLGNNCVGGENEDWRQQAHALKGSAMNMGAETLAAVCAKAQKSSAAPEEEKALLLQEIIAAYAAVKTFLQKLPE